MKGTSYVKLQLDDVCGKQRRDLKMGRSFQNHFRTHAEEKFHAQNALLNGLMALKMWSM